MSEPTDQRPWLVMLVVNVTVSYRPLLILVVQSLHELQVVPAAVTELEHSSAAATVTSAIMIHLVCFCMSLSFRG